MLQVSYRFLIIIAIILLGYIAKKFGIIAQKDGEGLARIVFNFTLPAVIIDVLSSVEYEVSLLLYPLIGLLFGLLMLALSGIFLKKQESRDRGMMTIPLLGINIGLFAIPLAQAIWGNDAVKYLGLIDIGNAFIIFGICYLVAARYASCEINQGFKEIVSKAIRSIPLITYSLSLLLRIAGWNYPKPILDIAGIFAAANTPVSMLALGTFLSFRLEKKYIKGLIKVLGIKYLAGIAVAVALYLLLPLDLIQKQVLLIVFILPASFSVIPYSVQFCYDTKFTGTIVNASIIISIALMWIVSAFF